MTRLLSGTSALFPAGTPAVMMIALSVAAAHLLTNGRYGFHRDELQFLSDGRHLDWGFVAYPPLTPFLERISLGIFGLSLVGLRLFSVIAQSIAIVVTGLMAREFGGRRWAQATAALGVAVSPLPLFQGTEFQYTTFDYLWWVLIAYFVLRLLNTEDPRWCLEALLFTPAQNTSFLLRSASDRVLGFLANVTSECFANHYVRSS